MRRTSIAILLGALGMASNVLANEELKIGLLSTLSGPGAALGNEIKDDAKIIGTTPPGQSLIGIVFVDTPLNVLFPCNFPEYVTGIFFSVSCSHTVNMNNAVIKIKRKNK